jgi:hypothetical protein
MAYHALGKFKCDGCRVIESGDIDLPSDQLGPVLPDHWLRVETLKRRRELDVISASHYCPACAPLIESYLQGRRTSGENGR